MTENVPPPPPGSDPENPPSYGVSPSVSPPPDATPAFGEGAVPTPASPILSYHSEDGSYIGPPPDSESRTMGMFCHLSALSGLIGVPLGHVLGPLIIWLIKKDQMPFVSDQGKESLNFQITTTVAAACCIPVICLWGVGIVLLIAVGITSLVFVIIATVKANQGIAYRYPCSIRFIK